MLPQALTLSLTDMFVWEARLSAGPPKGLQPFGCCEFIAGNCCVCFMGIHNFFSSWKGNVLVFIVDGDYFRKIVFTTCQILNTSHLGARTSQCC